MLPKVWSLLLLGSVIYPFLLAKFCSRSYINGKWITEGECGDAESMSQIMNELQVKSEDEKKWTVFQRRKYGNVSFYRGWDDYKNGFGDRQGDFWLGLEAMHQMTKTGNMEMKIKIITRDGYHLVAKYSSLSIGPGSDFYRLHVSGFSGNAHDALAHHDNQQFSTKDADHEGDWWYDSCAGSNLNGNFHETGHKEIWWGSATLRFSEMKMRKRA